MLYNIHLFITDKLIDKGILYIVTSTVGYIVFVPHWWTRNVFGNSTTRQTIVPLPSYYTIVPSHHLFWMMLMEWLCLFLPPENMSLLTSSRTATPILSLVITLFSMTSEPSELAMATWLNSTVCFWTKVNLQKQSQSSINTHGVQMLRDFKNCSHHNVVVSFKSVSVETL